MTSRRTILAHGAALAAVSLAPAGCGFVLYPERAGQDVRGLRLDPGILVLDGLLCLLFIVPGVVAFLVDVSSGCIYMPPPPPAAVSQGASPHPRRLWLSGRRPRDLEAAIAAASGLPAGRTDPRLRVRAGTTALPLRLDEQHRVPADIGQPAAVVSWVLDEEGQVSAFHVPA